MGWEGAFPYRRPADIFREHAALSGFENDGGRVFDIGALAGLERRRIRRAGAGSVAVAARRSKRGRLARVAGRRPAVRKWAPLRRRRAVPDRGRARPLRADPVPPAGRRRRQAPAAAAEYRPHPRPVAHDDANRPARTPDGASARAAARHPSGGRVASRSRRGRSRLHRERAWRDGIAGPPFGRAAPRRSLRRDALDRLVLVHGADRKSGAGRDRPGFRPARVEADRGAGDAGRAAVARSGAAPRRGSAERRVLLGARAAAAGPCLRSGRLGERCRAAGAPRAGCSICSPRRLPRPSW